jgi:hypothetical protein
MAAGPKGRFGVFIDRANINRISRRIMRSREISLDAAKAAFIEVTERIKKSSQVIVPYKTGDLYKSAYKRVTRRAYDIDARVGYDESGELGYAWTRHQVPAKTYTTPGTTHRYLALAFMQYEDRVAEIVAKAYRKRLKTVGFSETEVGGF